MATGKVLNICLSDRKGVAKEEVGSARLITNFGFENDTHAGNWHRQVSLLDVVDIREMEAKGIDLEPGAFGENLVLDGIPLDTLGIGSQLRLGDAMLEITQIGKVCHDRCAIYYTTGDCIMPKRGIFAVVLEGGDIETGTTAGITHVVPRETQHIDRASIPVNIVPNTTTDEVLHD